LAWWLAAIPIASMAPTPLAFSLFAVWLWGISAWAWLGTSPTSKRRTLIVNMMTVAIYGMAEILWATELWSTLSDSGKTLVTCGILATGAVLLVGPWLGVSKPTAEHAPGFLFIDTGSKLDLNFKHKLAWFYVLWLLAMPATWWLLFKLR
jgi:hypothetical protein